MKIHMGEDEVVVEGGDVVGAEVDTETIKKMVVTQTGVEKMVVTQTGAEKMVVTQTGAEEMVVTQTGAEVGAEVDEDIMALDMEETGWRWQRLWMWTHGPPSSRWCNQA